MTSKLTLSDAIQIRVLFKRGVTNVELAKRFGVTRGNITAIVQRRTHRVSGITEELRARAEQHKHCGERIGDFGE